MAEADFVRVMQRHMRAEVCNNFPSLLPQLRDLEQSAHLKLCLMREHPQDVKKIRAPIKALVKFLMDAPARVLLRIKKTEPLGDWDALRPGNQEAAFELKRLLKIATSLGGGMAQTMLAQAAHEMGDGRPLHEVLGVDRRSADKRLARARIAVLQIARGEPPRVEIEGETEVEDE